jgi:ammonia channel protein AmtB
MRVAVHALPSLPAPGWLSAFRRPDCSLETEEPLISGTMGVMDFAGSGVVHMCVQLAIVEGL